LIYVNQIDLTATISSRLGSPCSFHQQGSFRPGPVAAILRWWGPFGVDRSGEAVSREAGRAEEGVGRGSQDQSGIADGWPHRRRRCRRLAQPVWRRRL